MEYVVVLERQVVKKAIKTERCYAKKWRGGPRSLFGLKVRRGAWGETMHSCEAALFDSLADAKRVAQAALIRVMVDKGFRFSVHVVKGRRPSGPSGRLFAPLITAEVWPVGNPVDALAAVATGDDE